MSSDFRAPMGGALASQRWLGVTRIAAWICILLIALVCGVVTVQSGREEGTPGVAPFLVLAVLTLSPTSRFQPGCGTGGSGAFNALWLLAGQA